MIFSLYRVVAGAPGGHCPGELQGLREFRRNLGAVVGLDDDGRLNGNGHNGEGRAASGA